MSCFHMDGYTDLKEIAEELKAEGHTWARCGDGAERVVALVAQKLFRRIKNLRVSSGKVGMDAELAIRQFQERELFAGVTGIVQCAMDDGLIDEEE